MYSSYEIPGSESEFDRKTKVMVLSSIITDELALPSPMILSMVFYGRFGNILVSSLLDR